MIQLPILHVNKHYILPVSENDYGFCGIDSHNEFYNQVRFIDITGQEWLVNSVSVVGYSSWWRIFESKKEEVSFNLTKGKSYSFSELSNEVFLFLSKQALVGSPFTNKAKEIPEYLASFQNMNDLVAGLDYFDARRTDTTDERS